MKFITIADLSNTIRQNIHKIPRDIDLIVGSPRSGMIVASIISEYLNKPLTDLNNFINGDRVGSGGLRLRYNDTNIKTNRVLIVDDTVWDGRQKLAAKQRLQQIKGFEYIFLVAYLEGPGINTIDIYLDDVTQYTDGFTNVVFYEWNIFHHNEREMLRCMYDLDGVLCIDPPDERRKSEYEEYIKNAIPLYTPTTRIGAIVTYRLKIYVNETMEWLKNNHIEYNHLTMYDADSYEKRANDNVPPYLYKGSIFKNADWAQLFVESDNTQAVEISRYANKPVYCVQTNTLYGG